MRGHMEHIGYKCTTVVTNTCQRIKVQRQVEETLRLIKYATTNLRETLLGKTNSERTCNVQRMPNRQNYYGGTINHGKR